MQVYDDVRYVQLFNQKIVLSAEKNVMPIIGILLVDLLYSTVQYFRVLVIMLKLNSYCYGYRDWKINIILIQGQPSSQVFIVNLSTIRS